MAFKKYRRKQIAELRPVDEQDIKSFIGNGEMKYISDDGWYTVSISEQDELNGSPQKGDMIARNPKNHLDQWLVAEKYFEDNFEEI